MDTGTQSRYPILNLKGDPPKRGEEITLTIQGLGHSGEGVGHLNGFTLFVDGALPGETVRAKVIDCRKNFGFARLLSVITRSIDRVNPPCPLFGTCGGCQLMHLSYPKQLEAKREKVANALSRIGKIDGCLIHECIPSPLPLAYRNKIQLPVREGPSLGFYAKNSHDLIRVDHCLIHCELGEAVFQQIKKLLKNFKIEPYDPKTAKGELRHVLIKSGVHTKEVLIVLVTNQKKSPRLIAFAHAIIKDAPSVKGVIHNLHQENDNIILGSSFETLVGNSHILEKICDLTFSISAASFFQVNPLQAEKLYLKALALADVQPNETVLDAYCGVGTLSLIFSRSAKKVIGVECVAAAIVDAKENAIRNQINNVSFVCSPAEELIHKLPSTDILLLNPPRKGCDPQFLEGIKKLDPKKIVYISCDPATLARDLKILQTYGYKVDLVQPFDMFPQTSHVECVAKLSL